MFVVVFSPSFSSSSTLCYICSPDRAPDSYWKTCFPTRYLRGPWAVECVIFNMLSSGCLLSTTSSSSSTTTRLLPGLGLQPQPQPGGGGDFPEQPCPATESASQPQLLQRCSSSAAPPAQLLQRHPTKEDWRSFFSWSSHRAVAPCWLAGGMRVVKLHQSPEVNNDIMRGPLPDRNIE